MQTAGNSKKRGSYKKPPCEHGNKKKDCKDCKRKYNYEYRIKHRKSKSSEEEFCIYLGNHEEKLYQSDIEKQYNGQNTVTYGGYKIQAICNFNKDDEWSSSSPTIMRKSSSSRSRSDSDQIPSFAELIAGIDEQENYPESEIILKNTLLVSSKRKTENTTTENSDDESMVNVIPYKKAFRGPTISHFQEERDKELGPVVAQKYSSPGADPSLFSVFKLTNGGLC